jgi:SagB-type dehydrogenase family enzyme
MCVLTGTFSRSAWRYKERAYRRMLLDAGHLAGNLQCMVHEEQLQSFPLTGFVDQALSDLLFLDEGEEVPLLGIAVGKTLRISSSGAARSPIPEPDQLRVPEGVPFQLHAHRLGRISQLPLEHLPHAACASPLRADAEYQPLPDPLPILTENLPAVLALRRSCRRYQPQKMYLQDLSSILRYTWQTLMATPSAATQDRHLDTWLSVHNVDGLAPGIWHFDPAGHALTLVREGDFRNQVGTVCLGQTLGTQAAVVFFHTSPLAHAVASCGERIYRALCLDAGHIGQRLNLAAESIGLGFSGIGGYFDDEANALLGIPASEAIVYVSTLGVPAQEDA